MYSLPRRLPNLSSLKGSKKVYMMVYFSVFIWMHRILDTRVAFGVRSSISKHQAMQKCLVFGNWPEVDNG